MSRTIQTTTRSLETSPKELLEDFAKADTHEQICRCLAKHAGDTQWLIAHAEDSVVWGTLSEGQLLTGYESYPNITLSLRREKLLSCRLFGVNSELLLWRSELGWRARRYVDSIKGEREISYFDEDQILWGTQVEAENSEKGFSIVSDGVEGFRHVVPLIGIPFDKVETRDKQRPLRLTVRHYLEQNDDDGSVYIAGSRLVELSAKRI